MKKKTVEEKEINPYELDKLSKVPSWLIILFLKFWAAAAAVFYIFDADIFNWASDIDSDDLTVILANSTRLILIIALFLALFTNYIVKAIVRLMYNRRNNTYRYNLINYKGFLAFLLNLLYMTAVSFILFLIVTFLSSKGLVLDPFGTTGGTGIEPFSYAFYFIIVDSLAILIKDLIQNLCQRIQYKKLILKE